MSLGKYPHVKSRQTKANHDGGTPTSCCVNCEFLSISFTVVSRGREVVRDPFPPNEKTREKTLECDSSNNNRQGLDFTVKYCYLFYTIFFFCEQKLEKR